MAVIGIDLGTTNSVISCLRDGKPDIIPNTHGKSITPSIVAINEHGQLLVGDDAKHQSVINAKNTIHSVKRLMGNKEKLRIGGKSFAPEEVSAKILAYLKSCAEEHLNEEVIEAVITVPAYFNDNQRQATINAGRLAGLNVLRIINEPTAAALAYGFNESMEAKILVFDLGGGTFDVSILEISDGFFEVKATKGNNLLGGNDFDQALVKVIKSQFEKEEKISLSEDKLALQKLLEECELAKITLSESEKVEINIPFISADEHGPKHLSLSVSRNEFNDIIEEFIDETIELMKEAISDAGFRTEDIDAVLLVGGSTRIPMVRSKVASLIGEEKIKSGVNPEEVVSLGSSIQAGIVKGETQGLVLLDVTPLSLGIEIENNIFIPIIKRNSPIPTVSKRIFTTITDNQKMVEIHILQGERTKASENISLGKFMLSGIRQAQRGIPRIEVQFEINVDGIVDVSAKDLDSGEVQSITINQKPSLSRDEIEELIKKGIKEKQNDRIDIEIDKKKTLIKTKVSSLESLFTGNKSAIDDALKKEIEMLLKNADKLIQNTDNEKLEELLDTIQFMQGELAAEIEKISNEITYA